MNLDPLQIDIFVLLFLRSLLYPLYPILLNIGLIISPQFVIEAALGYRLNASLDIANISRHLSMMRILIQTLWKVNTLWAV